MLAEEAVVNENRVAKIQENVSLKSAAAWLNVATTSAAALFDYCSVATAAEEDNVVLIFGGGSSTGRAGLILARSSFGPKTRIIATCGDEKVLIF